MNFLKNLILKVVSFFSSKKAEAALLQAVELVPKALPIVKEIAKLTPNRTDDEIVAAFEKFCVPFASTYLATPPSKRGYVLLQLASQVLAARVPGVATNILNTAIQLAVTGALA
jgi:hypothetical protein